MTGQTVSIKGADGNFSGYLASPASGQGPGIVVIQEIFGINQVMRDIADSLAARGFFALAPDLFWRLEPDVQLTDRTDGEWQTAFGLMNRFDKDKGVEDIQASIDHLRGLTGVSNNGSGGKVGAVGYCLGGLLAYLTAARTDADACVGYYGITIQDRLEEAARIARPLMLHIAEADEYTPPAAREKLVAGLRGHPQVTLHVYPGVDHAFARVGGKHYDKACADLANSRTAAFFRQHLGSA
jgi:carboxymethylenebutenolidase